VRRFGGLPRRLVRDASRGHHGRQVLVLPDFAAVKKGDVMVFHVTTVDSSGKSVVLKDGVTWSAATGTVTLNTGMTVDTASFTAATVIRDRGPGGQGQRQRPRLLRQSDGARQRGRACHGLGVGHRRAQRPADLRHHGSGF